MMTLRKAKERGHFDHGWLQTYHSFSFGDYYDPKHLGFATLRVINEDYIDGGEGFPTHGHRDMEIITYPISGAIEHRDSTGGEGVIYPGEIQLMRAGSGIRHSEFNHLPDKQTSLLQIWIEPAHAGSKPCYEQINFKEKLALQHCVLAVSRDGREGSLKIDQDLFLWVKKGRADEMWNFAPASANRKVWVQVVKGKMKLQPMGGNSGGITSKGAEVLLRAGDGLAAEGEAKYNFSFQEESEILLFDMK